MRLRSVVSRLLAVILTVHFVPPAFAAELSGPAQIEQAITLQDLDVMRAALLEYLRASSLADQAALIRLTEESNAAIDGDGLKRIGQWRLGTERGDLLLTLRTSSGPQLIVNYRALVERAGGTWRVAGIKSQFIHGRR